MAGNTAEGKSASTQTSSSSTNNTTTAPRKGEEELTWDDQANRFIGTWNFLAVVNIMIFSAAMAALFSGVPPNPGVPFRQYTAASGVCRVDCEVAANMWFSAMWGATAASALLALGICSFWAGVLLRCHDVHMYNAFMDVLNARRWVDITFWPPMFTVVAGLLAQASLLYSLVVVFHLHLFVYSLTFLFILFVICMIGIIYLPGLVPLAFMDWRNQRRQGTKVSERPTRST